MGIALFCALVAVGHTGAKLDADAHKLVASAAAAADLRAPSAAIARVKAERTARQRAEKKIAAALVELGDKESPEALAKRLESATVSDEKFGSDGSVELTLRLDTTDLQLK
jgi:hypothetical protein